jgi:hypothetical protein
MTWNIPEKQLIETENNLGDDSASRGRSRHDILHSKIRQIPDKRASRPRVSKTVPPKHPLKGGDSRYHQTLEQKRESGFAPREAAIEKPNARDNQPDDESTENEVCVMVLEADILGIDIHEERVSTFRLGRVERRLGTY